jgi:hypothetical protein
MRSDKQKETSRRNGAQSRGPVTGAGKQRSAGNAARHYITSKALLIPGEAAEELEAHFAGYLARFQPADAVEADLVHNLAFITWRQRRLWRREADIITAETKHPKAGDADTQRRAASAAWRSLAWASTIPLLHREEAGLRRAYDRTLNNLLELRQNRPDPPPPDHDAKLRNEPEPTVSTNHTNAIPVPPARQPEPDPPPAELSEYGIRTVSSVQPPEPGVAACSRFASASEIRTTVPCR